MVYSAWYIIDIRILQAMISGIPLVLGLGTGMQDAHVFQGALGRTPRRDP